MERAITVEAPAEPTAQTGFHDHRRIFLTAERDDTLAYIQFEIGIDVGRADAVGRRSVADFILIVFAPRKDASLIGDRGTGFAIEPDVDDCFARIEFKLRRGVDGCQPIGIRFVAELIVVVASPNEDATVRGERAGKRIAGFDFHNGLAAKQCDIRCDIDGDVR